MNHSQTLAQLIGGIMTGGIRVIDLTVPLAPETPVIKLPPQFAPSKPFSLEEISRYDSRGPAWYWNNISCGEHTGGIRGALMETGRVGKHRFRCRGCGRRRRWTSAIPARLLP